MKVTLLVTQEVIHNHLLDDFFFKLLTALPSAKRRVSIVINKIGNVK